MATRQTKTSKKCISVLTALAVMGLLAGCAGQAPAPGQGDLAAGSDEGQASMSETGKAAGAGETPAGEHAGSASTSSSKKTGESSAAAHPATASPAASSAPAAQPSATPAPARNMITLPAGKKIKVELDSPLSTATSKVGDTFTCTVSSAVHLKDGTIFAVEKGAKVEGSVIEVASAKRVKGLAKLTIKFDSLDLRGGERIPISGSLRTEAESTAKRDTAAIAGGAAAGAILGKLIGKDSKDAVIGAIAGGAIGTGVVLGTKGKEVEIPAGTDLVIQLDQPVDVPAPMAGA